MHRLVVGVTLCCVASRGVLRRRWARLHYAARIVEQVGASHQDVGKPCSDGAATKKELTCVHDIEAFLNDVTRNTAMDVSIY